MDHVEPIPEDIGFARGSGEKGGGCRISALEVRVVPGLEGISGADLRLEMLLLHMIDQARLLKGADNPDPAPNVEGRPVISTFWVFSDSQARQTHA